MPALQQVRQLIPTSVACQLLGVARSSLYRWEHPTYGPRPASPARQHPSALTEPERDAVLAVLDDDRFADKAPEQVWAVLLDDGRYLCSVSTMYRILRAHNQIRERRAQASHPPRVIPELVATGPDQVFSWDITRLKGPTKGCYYDAYVIMDIYSRKIIHCEVHDGESGPLARDFLTNAIRANAGAVPRYVHSDNGTSMTSKTVAGLLADCHITRSLSRPHTSNDNPYSEAMFKTVKYCPAFPDRFGSLHDARQFMATFVHYYNHHHRHSGIGLHTPASVHDGTWQGIQTQRQAVLDDAYHAHPERFRSGRPTTPTVPKKAWINKPKTTIETSTEPNTSPAA